MKSNVEFAFIFACVVGVLPAQQKIELRDARWKVSYALGLDMISMFQQQHIQADRNALAAGISDVLAGSPKLTPDEKKAAIVDLFKELAAKAEAERALLSAQNLQAGRSFLVENARKPGVSTIRVAAADGSAQEVQYIILNSGTGGGPSPRQSDVVEVHYEGYLMDGTQFDSSVKRLTPATFGMGEVMPGWRAVLPRMRAGDKWRVFIPGPLGFGETGGAARFSPNSMLIYDLELLSFSTPTGGGADTPDKVPVARGK